MSFNTGKLINARYRVVHLLAEGGFGAVYKAWDININRPCALKHNLDSSAEAQSQFEREAQTLGRLSHPNLPRVTDHFFVPSQGQFLVMDYVEGVDLQTLVEQQGHIPEEQALAWAGQIADALTYLHSQPQPIIHRDIKPANIRVTLQGRAILVDFGLVKVYDQHLKTTMGARAVTPGYSPPEQYGRGNTDAKTDIYALAATVYTLLTGNEPQESVQRIVDDQVTPANAVAPATSVMTSAVLAKGMALRPTERYQTAESFREALLASTGTKDVTAGLAAAKTQAAAHVPANIGQGGGQLGRSRLNSRSILFLGVVILLVAAAIGWYLVIEDSLGIRQYLSDWLPMVAEVRQLEELEIAPAAEATPTLETSDHVTLSADEPVLAGTAVPQPAVAIDEQTAGYVTQLARWGRGDVDEVTHSPDGGLLAAASSIGIYLFDAHTLELEKYIETDAGINSVDFSPNGQTIAAGTSDDNIQLRRVSDGVLLHTLQGHTSGVGSVAFSPDGLLLASGSWDDTVRLWRILDGLLLNILQGHVDSITGLAFSPDGQTLSSSSRDDTIRLWDVNDGQLLQTIGESDDGFRRMSLSPDGQTLASVFQDETVKLWSVEDGELLQTLEGHTSSVISLAFSHDGDTLASGSWDDTIRLWNVNDGRHLQTLQGVKDGINTLSFSPDGQTLVSGSYGGALHLWHVEDGQLLGELEGAPGSYYDLLFSPDGRTLTAANWDDFGWVMRVTDGQILETEESYIAGYVNLAPFPDGERYAAGSTDGTIHIWRISDELILEEWKGHTDEVDTVSISADGETLASGSWDDTVRLWRVSDGQTVHVLEGHTDDVFNVTFSPDGQILASESDDGTVCLWRVSDGSLLHTLDAQPHYSNANALTFSPDGRMLITPSGDNKLIAWRVSDGERLHTMWGHDEYIEAGSFSPDGQIFASGAGDGAIGLWRVADGQLLRMLEGHTSGIINLAFSPDGRLLASLSFDNTVRIWGVRPNGEAIAAPAPRPTPQPSPTLKPTAVPPAEVVTLDGSWETVGNFNEVTDLALDGRTLWAATGGGLVKWNIDDGSYQAITVDEGLPSNDLLAVYIDSQGRLWVGSESTGLARFDDEKWTIIADESILGSNSVQDIVEDKDGNLWVGTQDAGASRFDGQNWQRFTPENSTVDWHVFTIFVDDDDSIWFGSGEKHCIPCGGGLAHYDGLNWERYGREDGLPGWDDRDEADVRAMVRVPGGDLWAGTLTGIARLQDGFWGVVDDNEDVVSAMLYDGDSIWSGGWRRGIAQYDADGRLQNEEAIDELSGVSDIVLDLDGSLWVAGWGLHRRSSSGVWSSYFTDSLLPGGYVQELVRSPDGSLLAAVGGEIWQHADGTWQPFIEKQPDVRLIDTIYVDRDGYTWAGGHGVAWLDDGDWNSDWENHYIQQIVQSGDGALWFNTSYQGAVLRFDSGEWNVYTYEDGDLPGEYIDDITLGVDDTVWIATSGGALQVLPGQEPEEWQILSSENGLKIDSVNTVFEDSQQRTWFASYDGLMVRLDDGTWLDFSRDSESGIEGVDYILEDAQGSIWAGGDGLSVYRHGEWNQVLPHIHVSDLIQARDGSVWVSTYDDGLCRVVNGQPTCLTSQDTGLASNTVFGLLEDEDGSIWIRTKAGLSHFSGEYSN